MVIGGADAAFLQDGEDLLLLPHQRHVHIQLPGGLDRAADDLAGGVVPAHGVYKDTHCHSSPFTAASIS